MAAEIHENTSVEAPAISDSEAATRINDDSHNVDSGTPSVNGTAASGSLDELANKHIADIVDDLVNSAEPSISGGSDTETSRLDALKNKDGNKEHVRTSSTTRKPTSFKSVSVNKTFLAAKAAGSPGVAKPGDKASPILGTASLSSAPSASARPRLVAKTGLVKGAGANGRPAAAPDPNAVWNKNRPAPTPEPRKFTDEELKKYGIHMATRLQQDDAKGQANWADIDDDDEDWAPEEIRWTDGTKSTIPHHEENSPPTQQLPPAQPDLVPPQAPPTSGLATSTVSSSLQHKDASAIEKPKSPAPGAGSQPPKPAGLPSGRGLILKGAPEKPTLVAKPPAPPTPVKSPWATLPPVDKASPIAIDLAPGVGASRLPHQQPFHQQPQRDLYGGPPKSSTPPPPFKEIAADDFSRGGFRDGHPHTNRELFNSQSGRLEPVTHRRGTSRGDMPYRQPPAALLQRPSQPLDQQPEPSPAFQTHRSTAQDGPYGRRRNSSNVSGGSGSFLQRLGRPNDQQVPPELFGARQPSLTGRSDSPASPRNFSPSGPRSWKAHDSPSATFATPYAGAAPDARPPVPGVPPASAGNIDDELEMQKKIMRERRELAKKRRLEEEAREEAAKRERIRLKLEAMGPAPERKSAKKEAAKEEASATEVSPAIIAAPLSSTDPSAREAVSSDTPDAGRGIPPSTSMPQQMSAVEESATTIDAAKPQQQQQQPSWQGPVPPQSERLSSWGSANQSSRNVWGSPNNNRSLGNGTFNSDLGRVSDSYGQSASQIPSKSAPGPIGPPAAQKSTVTSSIAPIGPPKPPAQTMNQTSVATDGSASSARSAWANAVKASDDSLLAQQKAHRAEQQREAEARGMSLQDLRPSIKDTWMPTRLNEEGDRVESKDGRSVVQRPGNTTSGANGPSSAIHSQQARPSRFFPTRDARHEEVASTAPAATTGKGTAGGDSRQGRPGSPSPPPPDMDGHPAFDGDAAHPNVSLPRPQIVVRLPPKGLGGGAADRASTTSNLQHAQLPAAQWSQAQPPQVSKEDSSWQAKFDHLFDRKVVSPSRPSAATGRTDLQPRNTTDATLVSPRQYSPTALHAPKAAGIARPLPKETITTRLMAEECFERQEMGSLPPVHLPNKAPELAWTPAAAPKPLPRRFILTTATSGDHEALLKDSFGVSHVVSIHFPGMTGPVRTVSLPMTRTHSNPRRSTYGRNGGRHASASHRGSNKGRDTASSHSGSHGNDHGQSPSSSHTPSGGRSRGGGMRHRSENWTRNTPSSVQT